MCIAMNGDQLSPGQYAVSTRNRNFEGRQGKGGRTLLASPADRGGDRDRRRRHRSADAAGHRAAGDRRRRVLSHGRAVPPVHQQGRPAARGERRHRPGRPGALPQDHRQGRPRGRALPRLALQRRRDAQGPAVRPRPARRWPAGTSSSSATTSGPAPRASTRRGRSRAWGIRAVFSTSFADIFRNNALKNGVLPIVVDPATHARLFALVEANPDARAARSTSPSRASSSRTAAPSTSRSIRSPSGCSWPAPTRSATSSPSCREIEAWEAAHPRPGRHAPRDRGRRLGGVTQRRDPGNRPILRAWSSTPTCST